MVKLKTVKKARNDLHPKYHREGASMATEELNKPTSLPPYTQMIMEDALKQTEVGKRKAAIVPKADKKKAKKDPNEPKRPPRVFFMFIEFRKTFKKENPNVKAHTKDVSKVGGEKWKSMSAAEKAPYQAKAAEKKVEYEKLMNAYNKTQRSSVHGGDEGSNRSRSEIHDDEA